ncbi:permease prefix domain 2-containing transporter [Roseivirga sp.]|uniref:permease prefix domain 2-containing transporter n=1 Tax=Roseivirga sp. TaxID=1964215 RepID=UPI003BAD6A72
MKGHHSTYETPKYADCLLTWFCKGDLLEEIAGDLYEFYPARSNPASVLRSE